MRTLKPGFYVFLPIALAILAIGLVVGSMHVSAAVNESVENIPLAYVKDADSGESWVVWDTESTCDFYVTSGSGITRTLDLTLTYKAGGFATSGMAQVYSGTVFPRSNLTGTIAGVYPGLQYKDGVACIGGSPVGELLDVVQHSTNPRPNFGVLPQIVFLAPEAVVSGPSSALVGETVTFAVTTTNGTTLFAADWSAGGNPGITEYGLNADMTWAVSGTYTVSALAANFGGAVTETHIVSVAEPTPTATEPPLPTSTHTPPPTPTSTPEPPEPPGSGSTVFLAVVYKSERGEAPPPPTETPPPEPTATPGPCGPVDPGKTLLASVYLPDGSCQHVYAEDEVYGACDLFLKSSDFGGNQIEVSFDLVAGGFAMNGVSTWYLPEVPAAKQYIWGQQTGTYGDVGFKDGSMCIGNNVGAVKTKQFTDPERPVIELQPAQ